MEIKVLGTGCLSCKTLYETTQQAIAELGSDATLVKEEDLLKIIEYNILSFPALVIDGKVVSAGKQLSLKEVTELHAMKKLFHVFIAGIILISCGNGAKEKTETANSETMQNDRVEVLYFHGAQVCFPYKKL